MTVTNNSGVRAVLLDLGDTLIHGNFTAGDSQQVWEEIYTTLINPHNDPALPTLPYLRHCMDEKVRKVMAATWALKTEEEQNLPELFMSAFEAAGLKENLSVEFAHQVIAAEQRLLYDRIVEVGPTVFSTLEELRRRGYVLGLVSNFCNITEVVYDNLNRLGLLEPFHQTILSCEVGWRKPSPHIYRAICQKLALEPAACLFVGDRLIEDVRGPQAFGMKAVLTQEYRVEEPTPEIQPQAVIKRLSELLELPDNLL